MFGVLPTGTMPLFGCEFPIRGDIFGVRAAEAAATKARNPPARVPFLDAVGRLRALVAANLFARNRMRKDPAGMVGAEDAAFVVLVVQLGAAYRRRAVSSPIDLCRQEHAEGRRGEVDPERHPGV